MEDLGEAIRKGRISIKGHLAKSRNELAETRKGLTGSHFLSVMGSLGDVTSPRDRLSGLHDLCRHNRSFLFDLKSACDHCPPEWLDSQLSSFISSWCAPLIAQACGEVAVDIRNNVESEFQRYVADMADRIDSLERVLTDGGKLAEDMTEHAVRSYSQQYPLADERMRCISDYEDDIEWIQMKVGQRSQADARIAAARDDQEGLTLDRTLSDFDRRRKQIQCQSLIDTDQKTITSIDEQIYRRMRPGLYIKEAPKPKAERPDFSDAFKETEQADRGTIIVSVIRKYFSGREASQFCTAPIAKRAIGDYDPKTARYWEYTLLDYTEEFQTVFTQQTEEMDRDLRNELPSWVLNAIDAPISCGIDKKHEYRVKRGDGVSLVTGLLSLYVPSSAVHQESLTQTITSAHEHFVGGNPKAKIEKILRPTLNEIQSLQVSLKAINTIQPMIRVLVKRDDRFKEIRDKECYKAEKLVTNNNCAPLLSQFFTDVCLACDDIERDNSNTKPQEVWRNNRASEANHRPLKAQHGDVYYGDEEEDRWYYDSNLGWVTYQKGHRGSKGGKNHRKGKGDRDSKGKHGSKGGKSYRKGKSGKGKNAPSDNAWNAGKDGQVLCANKGCWKYVDAHPTKRWGYLCTRCIGFAHQNDGKYYCRETGEPVSIDKKNEFVATPREKALIKTAQQAEPKVRDEETEPVDGVNCFGAKAVKGAGDDSEEEGAYEATNTPPKPPQKRAKRDTDDEMSLQ